MGGIGIGKERVGGNRVWERVGGERDREKERGERVKGDMDEESGREREGEMVKRVNGG